MPPQLIEIPIRARSQIGQARRQAERIARQCGLSDEESAHIALVAVEASTNILRHGRAGSILFNSGPDSVPPAVLMAAVDSGPGIRNLDLALEDGASSAGGIGGGLGTIKRMSDALDIYTQPGEGTVLTALFGADGAKPLSRCCGLLTPKPGYTSCGDGWAMRESGSECWALLCDGLGHGDKAASAAQAATQAFADAPLNRPDLMLAALDRALAKERGAAALVVRIDPDEGVAEAAGVGNISGAIIEPDGKVQRLVSQGGVVGEGGRTPHPLNYDWTGKSVLVLTTDGLRTIHDFGAWPGLFQRAPATIASVLHRDMNRRSDDSGVLVMKDCA